MPCLASRSSTDTAGKQRLLWERFDKTRAPVHGTWLLYWCGHGMSKLVWVHGTERQRETALLKPTTLRSLYLSLYLCISVSHSCMGFSMSLWMCLTSHPYISGCKCLLASLGISQCFAHSVCLSLPLNMSVSDFVIMDLYFTLCPSLCFVYTSPPHLALWVSLTFFHFHCLSCSPCVSAGLSRSLSLLISLSLSSLVLCQSVSSFSSAFLYVGVMYSFTHLMFSSFHSQYSLGI